LTTGDYIIGAILVLLAGKKASASTSSPSEKKSDKKAGAATDALQRIAGLQARANQDAATAWEPDLEAAGAPPTLARALARWIGIQSSGNPSKPSSAGELGLLQILPATAKEALTPGEWLQLKDPTTSRADQAKIALKQFRWHQTKAKKWVKDWPGDDTLDSVWYAKLHHSRPKSLSDAKLSGPAPTNARALLTKWKASPADLLRLAEANVVTWGSSEAP
jgi:hypothetical protein